MIFETPEDTYNAYERFLRKKEYKKAYRCLEKMLHQFPDDISLIDDIVGLCLFEWKNPEMARPWLKKLIDIRNGWIDYANLSQLEAELGNISKAKEYLKKSKELQKKQPWVKAFKEPKRLFSSLEDFIKYKEWNILARPPLNQVQSKSRGERSFAPAEKIKKSSIPAGQNLQLNSGRSLKHKQKEEIKDESHVIKKAVVEIPTYSVPVKVEPFNEEKFVSFFENGLSTLKETLMLIDYTYLNIQSGYDELLCLSAITDIEKYWYQIETVKKVLKHFRGRVLLCDEVGLGKTIEAGMLIKEYTMRGMIKNVLILTPAPLVSQWREEMQIKFGIDFSTTDDTEFIHNPINFWKQRFIIASINTAKSSKNMPLVTGQFYDLVVVDEAHHLRNRATLVWKLVNQIKKKFIFLLTATPVQNNLIELFNLITLLKPGQFRTEKQFKEEYIKKGNLKATADKEKLKELLREVMIRNTRSAIDLKLPKRFATTLRLDPTETEREIYAGINDYLKKRDLKKPTINLLLREAGSSPFALRSSLINMENPPLPPFTKGGEGGFKPILDVIDRLGDFCKGNALLEILKKNPDEKKIIFTQYFKSMDYITDLLWRHKIPYVTFRGDMPPRGKDIAIARFKHEIPILVSTESGGEGRNIQFCNTIINFDLPWNPMRIEQRIGRLHRIGQTRDVFIFNLSMKDTIEDYIIDILDNKINMFEMVIGEIEPILGYLGEDKDFEDIIMEIWLKSGDNEKLKKGFGHLGNDLLNAKQKYLNTKVIDNEIFGDDYEI
ncbi:MAG: ATP-dependent helicase [Nitrospira sp.]|nr:ATP-dependent helicase [Nitrospira sp.]